MNKKIIKQTRQIVKACLELIHPDYSNLKLLYNVKETLGQLLEEFPEFTAEWEKYIRQINECIESGRKHSSLKTLKISRCSGECTVCLDNLSTGITLECGHSFHSKCISEWARDHYTCPICREEF